MVRLIKIFVILLFLTFLSCDLKSKTELYLERDLDVLNNVKELNFQIAQDVSIVEIGVIRDQKRNEKNLVLKLNCNTNCDNIKNYDLIVEFSENRRGDIINIKPEVIDVKGNKYIVTQIDYNYNKISDVQISVKNEVNNTNMRKLSLKNLYTNND